MNISIRKQMFGVFSLLLLFLGPCVGDNPKSDCPASPPPQGLEGPGYRSVQQLPSDSGFMSSVVHSFLHSIQPLPFPKDLLVSVIVNVEVIKQEETIKKVLTYETGFLVCVAIGILYIILVPLIGFGFAFCRCCGNCGGRMYQKQTRSIHCKRRSFYWMTFLITFFILAGNVCMFLSNTYAEDSVRLSTGNVNDTLENLHSYFSNVPKQINQIINKGKETVDNVTKDVNDIGPLLGTQIQKDLEGPFQMTQGPVTLLAQVVNSSSVLLLQLNGTWLELQPKFDMLHANLTTVIEHINTTLSSTHCKDCQHVRSTISTLSIDTNLNLSNLNGLRSALDQAQKADLNKQIKTGQEFFASIPQRVTNETTQSVHGFKQQLEGIKDDILQLTSKVPLNTLNSITDTLKYVQEYISHHTSEVNMAEKVRRITAVIPCCLVLLVVVCNVLGLLLGPAGLKPEVSPRDRSCMSSCGGLFLMAGVGFSFLFSWALMIVVVILFMVGANMYTLICVPWQTGQLFQAIDSGVLLPDILSRGLGHKVSLTIHDVYIDCQHNKSLWMTLHLGDTIDLNDVLNVSKYTENVHQAVEKMNITLPSITLLSPAWQNQLQNISTTANNVKLTGITQKINAIAGTNLSLTADVLDMLAAKQPNLTIKGRLQKEANDLRSLQMWINITINPLMQLNSTVGKVSVAASQVSGTVENVLENFSYAQNFLNNNTTKIVKSKSRDFVDCQMEFFTTFAKWANESITEQVGACAPVAQAVDTAKHLVCMQLVESLNAFWFSLGWCLVFLIPSIIFSVKLAKYYRRMTYADENESFIMMNPILEANMKPY